MLVAHDSTGSRVEASLLTPTSRYFCPACGSPVIAKPGRIKVPHFAHTVTSNCPSAGESADHLFAKRILAERFRAAVAWTGRTHTPATTTRAITEIDYPMIIDAGDPDAGAACGAAVFTRRGDHRATGWLAEYGKIGAAVEHDDKSEARPVRRGLGRITS
jgi:hypothetical protein